MKFVTHMNKVGNCVRFNRLECMVDVNYVLA